MRKGEDKSLKWFFDLLRKVIQVSNKWFHAENEKCDNGSPCLMPLEVLKCPLAEPFIIIEKETEIMHLRSEISNVKKNHMNDKWKYNHN